MRRWVRFGVASVGFAIALSLGCNLVLGIDEQGRRPPPPDATAADGPVARPTRCTVDAECTPPNGCYTGRCDAVLGACSYALCESKGRACAAGTCNPTTLSCENERDYGFRTTSYAVPNVVLGCGKNAGSCVAGAFPFLFVATPTEVVALAVDDVLATRPRTVPLGGTKLEAEQILVSGRRLWILGRVQGTAPPYQLPIVTVDVPSDPTLPLLPADTGTFSYPYPSATAFPAPNGGIWIAYNDVAQAFPTASMTAPLPSGGVIWVTTPAPTNDAGPTVQVPPPPSTPTHVLHRVPLAPTASSLAAASGDRLVLYRFPGVFNLVTGPATASAKVEADAFAMPVANALQRPRFANGPDGSVLQVLPVNADPAADCNCNSKQRVQWVLPNAIATALDDSQLVDVESYVNPNGGGQPCHTCQYFSQPSVATWLDRKSALVAAPAGDTVADRGFTAVRVITRDPLAAPTTQRYRRTAQDTPKGDFANDRIAVASAAGFGYLVLADSQGNGVDVSIFDPRCDAK